VFSINLTSLVESLPWDMPGSFGNVGYRGHYTVPSHSPQESLVGYGGQASMFTIRVCSALSISPQCLSRQLSFTQKSILAQCSLTVVCKPPSRPLVRSMICRCILHF